MINFNDLFRELTSGVASIAQHSLKDFEQQATKDGKKALENAKANLEQWTKELETGAITKEDLGDLLQEEVALTEMIALKQTGLAEVRLDQFRNDIIDMIVGTVTGLIKV